MKRFPINYKKVIISILIFFIAFTCFAKSGTVVKVGYFSFNGYQNGNSDEERKSGYAYEYIQNIASYTGWKYEYDYDSKASLLEKLKKGEINLFLGLSKDYDTDANIVYSERPVIYSTFYLFQSSSKKTVDEKDLSTLNGKTIGILQKYPGEAPCRDFLNENNVTCEFKYYSDFEKFIKGFYDNEFDAFVSTDLDLGDASRFSVIAELGQHSLHAAFNAKDVSLINEFNIAQDILETKNPFYTLELTNKYFKDKLSSVIKNNVDYSWFNNHEEITIGYLENYLPFSAVGKGGEPKGLIVDIVQDLRKNLPVIFYPIKLVPYANIETAYADVESGKINAFFPFYGDHWIVEQHNQFKTDEVYSLVVDLLVNKNFEQNTTHKIAVTKVSPVQLGYVETFFADSEIVYCKNLDDCVKAVRDQKADATIINKYKVVEYLRNDGSHSLELITLTDACPVSFLVSGNDLEFLLVFNDLLTKIDRNKINKSVLENSIEEFSLSPADYLRKYSLVIVICILILAILIGYVSYRYTMTVRKRARTTRKQKELLESLLRKEKVNNATISALSKLYVCIYYINMSDYTFQEIDTDEGHIHSIIGDSGDAEEKFRVMLQKLIYPEYLDVMREFTELRTLRVRMSGKKVISQEFLGTYNGWCEALFVISDLASDGSFTHVTFAVRSISKEKELLRQSNTDELTGCYNRRSFEADIINIDQIRDFEDLVFVTLDINGLKNVNDSLGHQAGDELILGASQCIENTFGMYGKIYRTGGDEFMGIITADSKRFKGVCEEFSDTLKRWKGMMVDNVSISYGYASIAEFPNASINDLIKISDKRMYEAKEHFYATKGVDRRSNQAAFEVLRGTFQKILRVDLKTDEYQILLMDDSERTHEKGFRDKYSKWVESFATSGQVKTDNIDEFMRKAGPTHIRNHFKHMHNILHIHYQRKVNDEFKNVVMEILPSKDYSNENQIVFIYVKVIER